MNRHKVTRQDRELGSRKNRQKKRRNLFSTTEMDSESFASTSAKKLKNEDEIHVPEDVTLQYAIIDFFLVFSTLSCLVKCSNVINNDGEEKVCDGKVEFKQCAKSGLGFKIMVQCEKCRPTYILASQQIGQAYEINRRFIFVMRILGIGLKGCDKFCALMDIRSSFINQSTYDFYVSKMLEYIRIVAEKLFCLAAEEEKKLTCDDKGVDDTMDVTVSGDGTWKKRGFSSLYGVATLIGYHSEKVLDVFVKSSYCKICESWRKKLNSAEFEEWQVDHIKENECSANHKGPAGNMEVSSIVTMFLRSIEKYGLRYHQYIGDGDSKTYSGVIHSKPYGEHFQIIKKECVGHVQKRMGTRLRTLVNKTFEEKESKGKTIRKKSLSGRGKLTGKLIDKLTVYYGLAIRNNSTSVQGMKNAIWATYYHYSSTDENPQHEKCPSGADSWCAWQRASATDQLSSFHHEYDPIPSDVLSAIKPIYEDLSNDTLLERCVGGFTQNNNESLNQLIWKISPKILPAGSKIVEIAAYIAACTFNIGTSALLIMLHGMDVKLGRNSHEYAQKEDAQRILQANKKAEATTREARILLRQQQKDALDIAAAAGPLLYGAGIDDSM